MFIIKIIFILFLIKICSTKIPSQLPNLNSTKINGHTATSSQKQTLGLRFRLPFMDMEIENQRNLYIMQEQMKKQQIFVLHGNEFYEMFVSGEEKRLSFIGILNGSLKNVEPLGAEIIMWRDYFILVVAMEEQLEVYQIFEKILGDRTAITKDPKNNKTTAPIFEPIQQLSLPGSYRKHFLVDVNKEQEQIVLIVGINFTKLYGRLNTFLWSNTYFEPIEEATIPPIHVLYVVGNYPKYLLRGRVIKHQSKTIITVYEILSSTMMLSKTQTLTANSRTVHAATYRGKNYLIACSSQQKECNSFRMGSDGLFSVYKLRSSKEFAFNKFTAGPHFLVASLQDQVMVYTNGRLDCYASFLTNETDVTSILPLLNNHGEDFILLNYKRPLHTLVRMIELESESGGLLGSSGFNGSEIEDTSMLSQHRHIFEDTIGQLRSLLLRRRNAIKTFWKINIKDERLLKKLQVPYPVRIHTGTIKVVNVVGENLRSPLQLLQRVAQLRQRFASMRFKRDIGNDEEITAKKLLKVNYLNVQNLKYEGNILNGFHLDLLAKPLPILSVRPKLTTKKLFTQNLLTRLRAKRPPRQSTKENSTLPVLKFHEINVERINGVSWQDFYNSLFLKNRDKKIRGSLVFQAKANVRDLYTPLLDGVEFDNLFNLLIPQVIHSNIFFSGFMTRVLEAETFNGLDFANDLVFQNTESFIETPVKFYHLSISEELLLDDNGTSSRVQSEEETDFQQYYIGNVVINGSLTVQNLLREEDREVEIFVNETPFSKSILKEEYLLINESQTINSTIILGNAKLTLPSLTTKFLNDHPIEEYLLTDQPIEVKKPLLLIFMNAYIEGDLECKPLSTKLGNISSNAIRHGDVANITGTKFFEAPLKIENVMTLSLNKMPVSDLVLKSQLKNGFKFEGLKSFHNVEVENIAYINTTLNSTYLNQLPLEELLNSDYHFKRLEIPYKLKAENFVINEMNGISFDNVLSKFKFLNEQLVLHKDLIIEGNVNFVENFNVQYINDLNWHDYQNDLVRVNENAVLKGEKIFQNELTISDKLNISLLNQLPLEKVFLQILSKSRSQVITGNYTFGYLELSNLDVDFVNGVNSSEFIDTRLEILVIKGDIVVPKITSSGDVLCSGEAIFELKDFVENIAELPQQRWRNILVTGNAYWNNSTNVDVKHNDVLSYLYKNAVKRTGLQNITGNVKLKRPIIRNMKTKNKFPNDIDIDYLVEDCVLKNSNTTQVITAPKTFLLSLRMHEVVAKQFVGVYTVNDIDVQQFNDSLFYLSSDQPIVGPLYFKKPPIIGHMIVRQHINGIEPSKIYHNITQKLPPLSLKALCIEDGLEIGNIDNQSLNYFLHHRIPKNSKDIVDITGSMTFESLILKSQSSIQTINDIPIDKLVFKRSNNLQAITGTKIMQGNLILQGPAHVMNLNGQDLIEIYQESVFRNREHYFDRLSLTEANFKKGLIVTNTLEPVLGSARQMESNNKEISLLSKSIEFKLDKLYNKVIKQKQNSSTNILYLDYVQNSQVLWQSSNISSNKIFKHELPRLSLCERKYLNVQLSDSDMIFLSNITSTSITAYGQNLTVKAENFCQQKYRKVKSKITIVGKNFTKVIGLKKYMENIAIYSPNNESDIFLLLHAIEFTQNRHEVRVLRISASQPENITDWQSLTVGIGRNMLLFSNENYTALVSGAGLVNNHPALSIYHFNISNDKFELVQTIEGDFDVFEIIITLKPFEYQLILSCHRCRNVHIYYYNPEEGNNPYQILQILKLKTHVDRIKAFTFGKKDLPYMLFLAEHGEHYYYLYRYTQLQGWIHTTYGYFESTDIAVPLIDKTLEVSGNDLLILLCSWKNCNLVKIVRV